MYKLVGNCHVTLMYWCFCWPHVSGDIKVCVTPETKNTRDVLSMFLDKFDQVVWKQLWSIVFPHRDTSLRFCTYLLLDSGITNYKLLTIGLNFCYLTWTDKFFTWFSSRRSSKDKNFIEQSHISWVIKSQRNP